MARYKTILLNIINSTFAVIGLAFWLVVLWAIVVMVTA
jgi:hypothetical protein